MFFDPGVECCSFCVPGRLDLSEVRRVVMTWLLGDTSQFQSTVLLRHHPVSWHRLADAYWWTASAALNLLGFGTHQFRRR
jgi:hypothetical protein